VSPATVIGSLLFLFLTLLVMAIAVSLYDVPQPARKQPARKTTPAERTPRQEIRPVVLNRAERMELIESTRNMVVTHPAGVARLVRNWISDGS
jgi:flagellar biosynthesis/type III secretory pathway M-ring protein FliF/YscJ